MIQLNIGKLSSLKTAYAVKLSKESGKKIITNLSNFQYEHEKLSDKDFLEWFDWVTKLSDDKLQMYIELKFKGKFWLCDEITNLFDARRGNSKENDNATRFIMMLGKLDCDLVGTCQVLRSQADKRLRQITDTFAFCTRVDSKGMPQFFKPRIVNYDVFCFAHIYYDLGHHGLIDEYKIIDCSEVYGKYNTRQILLLNR